METTVEEFEPAMDNIAINNSLNIMRMYGGILDEND